MAVKVARRLGPIVWELDVPGPKMEPYRDTTGPGAPGWKAMIATAKAEAADGKPKTARDLALVRLLHDQALRRGEAVALDAPAGSVAV
jgi:integrase/recombinase XerC